jgi:hypothetical protein
VVAFAGSEGAVHDALERPLQWQFQHSDVMA